MRNTASEIGEALRKRRELLGLLQPKLAVIAGVSTRTIQLIEAGKANPSLGSLFKIADSLGLAVKMELKGQGKYITLTTELQP